jgi:AraC family transcriptional activator of mtrCDE
MALEDAPLNSIMSMRLGGQPLDPVLVDFKRKSPLSNITPNRLSASDLNNLIRALDIDVVALTEILVPRGHRVEMGRIDVPGIHYNLAGKGRIAINGGPFMPLRPHLLIIVPPNTPFVVEVDGDGPGLKSIERNCWTRDQGYLRVSPPGETPEVVQICGFFNASFGPAIGLFRELKTPVIEQFEPIDRVDEKLREAMAELLDQEVGMGAMTAALLKQVIISLLRRSMASSQNWTERFTILSDRQITRAFADMVASPSAPHTVQSLAHSAGMSRSAFMSRFTAIVGRAPMSVLRDLRMRQAALDLTSTTTPIEVIAHNAGYESRSSFARRFAKVYGKDPTEYRATTNEPAIAGTEE